ncbi:DUF3095 domain-containing protein [Mucilaginibacter dorajii]|uniref:DUF3095 domain-containing protein n=1 Tax=Mucilaginibacter dorajii TaxID=692994 RepID=A0ABP7PPC7_9SPHI|nr:DUF3095 domain-containing protein [Mucilaginibacter dorajii]MCS3733698.1 hypothetical protein [Mucilaginibacter dorajii]
MSANNDQFYAGLPVNEIPLGDLFINDKLFYNVPENWHVIITDIKGSTTAVMDGKHENVNLVATGSIVSALNIAFKADIAVPFFFGGDGATFMVPPSILQNVMQALALHKDNTLRAFELELRTGTIPVKQIYDAGYKLRISKFCSSGNFAIPIVLGNGLSYAEREIKGNDSLTSYQSQTSELDLGGMQCRWDKIPPPEDYEEVLTLLVVALHEQEQPEVFRDVICHIDRIYGNTEERQPISVPKLKLKTTFNQLEKKMRTRISNSKIVEILKHWGTMLITYVYLRTKKGKKYLDKLVEMSDTLVIDGKINTVITGTPNQRKELQEVLSKMEDAGQIYYGFHVSSESVMSCYVRDLEDDHIHFVDGAEGGYTKAAGFIKQKLAR